MRTVFEIGMYDGTDTAYYLECGYGVIAVEANPDPVRYATRYGVPFFLKVDIEGSDRYCILSLTPGTCPRYLSFELGDDVDELSWWYDIHATLD